MSEPAYHPSESERQSRLALLARHVGQHVLPQIGGGEDRAQVYEALALILPGAEAEQAAYTAFAIRNAEQGQLKMAQILENL